MKYNTGSSVNYTNFCYMMNQLSQGHIQNGYDYQPNRTQYIVPEHIAIINALSNTYFH